MIRVKQLESLPKGEWISDGGSRGGGQMHARRLVSGAVAFYFRYTLPDGKRDALRIGEWKERGGDGDFYVSLEQARAVAAKLRDRYQSGERDLRGADRERAALAEHKKATDKKEAERLAEEQRRRGELSLGALLGGYVDYLRAARKVSADDVELALFRHIRDPRPELWALPVDDVDGDAVSAPLDCLVEAGKKREADKLRAYLRAAFSVAVSARQPGGYALLRPFNVKTNPLRDLPTIQGARNARVRALELDELRAYWKRIAAMPAPHGPLLRFHLLTGAQRVTQLGRLTTQNLDGNAVVISDGKGKRTQARLHLVPLIPAAVAALNAMATPRTGPFLLTVSNGETAASYDVIGLLVRKVAADMVNAGEAKAPFTVGDLRRTVETRLAAVQVSKDARAHLQSHGLSGVQHKHYDVHDYLPEKRQALERLHRLVTQNGSAGNVKAIRG